MAIKSKGKSFVLISVLWRSLPPIVSLNQVSLHAKRQQSSLCKIIHSCLCEKFVSHVCCSSTHVSTLVKVQPAIFVLGSGSDAASLLTSAQRKGDHYVLNGSKVTQTCLYAHVI